MSELPKSWLEVEISNIADVVAGGTPKAKEKSYFESAGAGIAWLTPADLSGYEHKEISHGKRDLSELGLQNSSAKLMPAGSLLFSSRAPIGYVAVASNEIATNQGFKSFVFTEHVNSSYAYYYLKSIRGLAESRGTGTTFKELSGAVAKKLPFKLAPLNEQIRIANKLDSILAKVDKAQARLDKIPAILKRFRQSVLAAAMSGELTKQWRESKDLYWEVTSFGKLIKNGPQNGIYKPSKLYGSGTKIIRIDGFYDGELSPWASIKSVQLEKDELVKWKLNVDDILINRVNSIEYLGKCGHVNDLPEDAVFESNIMRVELDKLLATPRFIKFFLSSPIGLMRLRSNAKHAVNQASINQTDVKSVEIHLPNLEEQTLIADVVETLFAKSNRVEKQHLEAKARLDRLTQSILVKAFRGELVPQDPNDEPADKLLERILAERELAKPKKKTTRKRATKAKVAD